MKHGMSRDYVAREGNWEVEVKYVVATKRGEVSLLSVALAADAGRRRSHKPWRNQSDITRPQDYNNLSLSRCQGGSGCFSDIMVAVLI